MKLLSALLITFLSVTLMAQDPRDLDDPRNAVGGGSIPVSSGPINISVGAAGESVTGKPPQQEAPASVPGPLSNQEVLLGRLGIPNLIALEGGAPPTASTYRNGKLVVGDLVAPAIVAGEDIYEVTLYRPSADETGVDQSMVQIPQTFSLTASQIRQLMTESAADQADLALSNVIRQRYPSPTIDCSPYGGTYYDESSYREDTRRRANAPVNPPLPPERYERGSRSPSSPSPTYGGTDIEPGLFSSGRATSVGDGTGLINMRENDPNANRQTPGCEALAATPQEREGNPELEMTSENLTRCIEGIQDFILQGVSQPPRTSDRALVFRRLFDLPNHEQEFAAAIFTVDGEAGHHARENPMEGIMVLKTLSNRRDNANGVEAELQQCRDNFSDPTERASCFGDANADATYNLLDIALDRLQFSMYNSGEGGNWNRKFGHKRSGQFEDAINSFIAYEGMEEWTINGGRGNANIHGIYHYHTPAVRPEWRNDSLMLNISGTHETLGTIEATSAHVFYYNHDIAGREGDGWRRNVRHEFRDFPQ